MPNAHSLIFMAAAQSPLQGTSVLCAEATYDITTVHWETLPRKTFLHKEAVTVPSLIGKGKGSGNALAASLNPKQSREGESKA